MRIRIAVGTSALAMAIVIACAAPALAGGNLLIDAVKAGDRAAVQAQLRTRGSADAVEADGTTALHWAVRANNADIVSMLLRAGAAPNRANRYGVTPLTLAATNGNASIVEMLIKAGADPRSPSAEGEPPLMTAANAGSVDVVRALARHGADVNVRDGWMGETALMWAASENHPAVVKTLIALGADVNARSSPKKWPNLVYPRLGLSNRTDFPKGEWTALMYAARDGAWDAVRALVESGASLDLTDPDGATALVFAIINAHYDVAELLLESSADPNVADVKGMSALYAAVDMNTLGHTNGRPAPIIPGPTTTVDMITTLLTYGADPDVRLKAPILRRQHADGDPTLGDGSTPLMRAAKAGDLAVMRILLDYGADPTLRQKNGSTVLMLASGLGRRASSDDDDDGARDTDVDPTDAVRFCLEHGGDVNAANDAGDTALHVASSDAIVRVLAQHGAKLDVKNKRGLTPLAAAQARRPNLVATIQELLTATR
jgi:ankyrin repeat protein